MSTQISWTDETWNPTTGCSKVSSGCKNCYAAKMAPRLAAMGQKGYTDKPWTASNASENIFTHPDRLEKPLHWRKPRRVFVNSMSDLFHEQVPDEFIDQVFKVMALASQHTFQVLTKRPERMADYLNSHRAYPTKDKSYSVIRRPGHSVGLCLEREWPLPNVWLGASVEDQRAADERIPHLLRTPAAVRFLSCEPLLGSVDLTCVGGRIDSLQGDVFSSSDGVIYAAAPGAIDWVIAGGESGSGYRVMEHEWARGLRDQCVAAGVPYFFKQSSGAHNEMNPYLDGESWHQFPKALA